MLRFGLLAAVFLPIAAGCSSPTATSGDAAVPDSDVPGACQAPIEAEMSAGLDVASTNTSVTTSPDFTVLLETYAGHRYGHAHGTSSSTTVYESASTSKLVTAVVILDAVDSGALSLTTKAHDLLPFWTETTVTLRDLLSFTSGFSDEPVCLNNPIANFETCVQTIYTSNEASAPAAGTQFYYASTHLQVAGLMAMKAKNVATWTALFDAWRTKTGLFPSAAYDLPSTNNPRLAGGMHWTAEEYLGFLRALAHGFILSDASRTALFANQRGAAAVAYSPALGSAGEDWAYGLGNWLECATAHTAGSFDCGEGHRNSSPGAYGAYPFIDFDHRYFGIVARQGAYGTGYEGVNLLRATGTAPERWAACP